MLTQNKAKCYKNTLESPSTLFSSLVPHQCLQHTPFFLIYQEFPVVSATQQLLARGQFFTLFWTAVSNIPRLQLRFVASGPVRNHRIAAVSLQRSAGTKEQQAWERLHNSTEKQASTSSRSDMRKVVGFSHRAISKALQEGFSHGVPFPVAGFILHKDRHKAESLCL